MSLSLHVNYKKNLDLITFFTRENTISCPLELWFETICASLRLKHSVLVLMEPMNPVPNLDETKRLASGENWFSLAPRGLGLILEANSLKAMTIQEFMSFLRSSK